MSDKNYELFIESLNSKKIIIVTFDSHEKGVITRTCIPFDFGPSRRYKDGQDRYHFYDLDSPDGSHQYYQNKLLIFQFQKSPLSLEFM